MSLKVIGVGFGRTGTLSLKLGLEQIGFDPCYHMMEVFKRDGHVDFWHNAAFGAPGAWDPLFTDFSATVDWPAAHYWRELVAHYPDAKVVLTIRDSERWYESVHSTIYQAMIQSIDADNPVFERQREMANKIILEDTFGGRFQDRAHAIGIYEQHNETVQKTLPSSRLLTYQVADGFGPLCQHLGVATPDAEFPHVNSTEEFRDRFGISG